MSDTPIDKSFLYGAFQKVEDKKNERKQRKADWLDDFGKKQAYKHADIAIEDEEEGMNFFSDNRKSGLDWKGLGIIAASILGAGYLFGNGLPFQEGQQQQPQPVVDTDTDTDTQYNLEFGE